MDDFHNRMLKERLSLSLGAPELKIDGFLNSMLRGLDQSEPGSLGIPNVLFSEHSPQGNRAVLPRELI